MMLTVVAVVFTIGLLAGGYLFWTGRDRHIPAAPVEPLSNVRRIGDWK